jgi:hypothetical protein
MGFPQSLPLSVGRRPVRLVGPPGRALGGLGADRLDSGVKTGFNSSEPNPLPPLSAVSDTKVASMPTDPTTTAPPPNSAVPSARGRREARRARPRLGPLIRQTNL